MPKQPDKTDKGKGKKKKSTLIQDIILKLIRYAGGVK